jgi:hypothetical protein
MAVMINSGLATELLVVILFAEFAEEVAVDLVEANVVVENFRLGVRLAAVGTSDGDEVIGIGCWGWHLVGLLLTVEV